MTLAITAGILVTGAVYLILKREMLRVILGFILLGHAANIVIFSAGGSSRRDEPFGIWSSLTTVADPLPQAFVLTAIVISFSITILMLVLSVTGGEDDDLKLEEPERMTGTSAETANEPEALNAQPGFSNGGAE